MNNLHRDKQIEIIAAIYEAVRQRAVRRIINSDQSNERLAAIFAGAADQSELLNDRLGALIRSSDE